MRHTPNFTGWQAAVLHRSDSSTDKLTRQLKLLGITPVVSWEELKPSWTPDLVLVDADMGWDALLPWDNPENAPCPVVALLGSEAPGRIAWAMQRGAGAILAKPIATSAIYPAVVMAIAIHEERCEAREGRKLLEERVRMRPLVHRAVEALMQARKFSEEDAYGLLRSNAMRRRETIESIAASYLAGHDALPEVV